MALSLALITARGGSKRIPHKNIKPFLGKPIICYSIDAAIKSGVFDEVMVSTDDEEIAEIARKAGANVPFMRSSAASDDHASTDDVIAEVLSSYETIGKHFDRFCCIYPTAPFITSDKLCTAMSMLGSAESVLPVVQFSYPPQRGMIVTDGGELRRRYPEYAATRSQDLERFYHDCGQFYACRTDAFLRGKTTDVDNMVPMIMDETEVQDIDNYSDWKIAEAKYTVMHDGSES